MSEGNFSPEVEPQEPKINEFGEIVGKSGIFERTFGSNIRLLRAGWREGLNMIYRRFDKRPVQGQLTDNLGNLRAKVDNAKEIEIDSQGNIILKKKE